MPRIAALSLYFIHFSADYIIFYKNVKFFFKILI